MLSDYILCIPQEIDTVINFHLDLFNIVASKKLYVLYGMPIQ